MGESTGAAKPARIACDPEYFERFYREHVEAVQRFVARRTDDPHLAFDLTAEVFLAAIDAGRTRPENFRGEPRAWLYGVARNVIASHRRDVARGIRAKSRIAGRALLDSDDIIRIEDRIDAEASGRELYHAMDQLPDGERAVLELVALDGLTVGEAAKALGIRGATARVRLHRARRRLRKRLAPSSGTRVVTATEVQA